MDLLLDFIEKYRLPKIAKNGDLVFFEKLNNDI
jgi:hypothetical protein